MRAICTAIWGSKFVVPAAAALQVQQSRIRWWINERQDDSPYRSSPSIRAELEQMFLQRLRGGDAVVVRVDQLADAVEYLDDLIESADAQSR
jgi:hypothetical protein